MGSARVSQAKPTPMENSDKKSIKTLFKALFNKKKDKRPDKKESGEDKSAKDNADGRAPPNVNPVDRILENFNKINIKDDTKEVQEDDEDIFSFKVIEEEPRNERINSQTSEDSGYSDSKEAEDKFEKRDIKTESADRLEKNDAAEEVTAALEKLGIEDEKKKKKWQIATVSRGPIRSKARDYASSTCPYSMQEAENFRQIHQINKQTLTGGQVIVNQCPTQDLTEVDIALKHVENQSQFYQKDPDQYLADVLEYINEDSKKHSQMTPEYTAQDIHVDDIESQDDFINNLLQPYPVVPQNATTTPKKDELNTILFNIDEIHAENINTQCFFPTPPRSENVPSPMLESPSSFYQPNSEYTLSPGSPVYHSDYENYQVIPPYEENKDMEEKTPQRSNSISSKTMKQFKDMQKEIAFVFAKKECCQISRRSCKEIFQGHLQKLKSVERRALCFKVARLDAKTAFGVLHQILLSLSQESEQELLEYALFGLLCVHILSLDAALFAGETGLSVLKAAALRCPHRPVLTRQLVKCIRTALKADPSLSADKQALFHEVDGLGDNLVIACARAGDRCADVLSELVREEPGQPPLFRTHHANSDGYTALHVACTQHCAGAPRLHTVHVLLEHAQADLWKGDIKGGDTALHLAVNSANCDLQLIMLLFKHVDRKVWKSLAHCQNMSGSTPIEYARTATKSSTRQNYPPEVLEFLKKCR